jgi:hypothetical protein
MTDAETTAAENALAYRIRERDAAMRDGAEDVADPEVFAHEFFTALRTKGGWRPTEARRVPAWNTPRSAGTGPTEEFLAAKAALAERLAKPESAA